MQIVRTAAELGDEALARPGPIYLVPTMGAFHEGHLSLMRMAAADRDADEDAGTVVVSLFVNPTQFNDPKDLQTYPRDEARDAAMAEKAGCDLLFVPDESDIYPGGFGGTKIHVPNLSQVLDGEHRPGHFDAVATVVAKLFHLVLPDYAYFGEKDWQQCRVIERMVLDLDFPVWLRFGETVREPDGLAMSSRNALLRPEVRPKASALYRALQQAAEWVRDGQDPRLAESEATRLLLNAGFASVDYVAAAAGQTLKPLEKGASSGRVLGAAHIGGVRLIDNIPL